MKIELKNPFASDWRLGYLRESSDGRKRVDLFNSNFHRTTVSYSRYLMSCHLGRYLTDNEEVDHKDTDNSNDDVSNLQILTVEDHRNKTSKERSTGRAMTQLVCAYCNTPFNKENRLVKKNQENYFCSRSCNGKFYWSKGFNPGVSHGASNSALIE